MKQEGIVWNIEKRKLSDLKLWDKNPRTITEQEYARLKNRLVKRGFHDVLKIDTENVILSGNQRKQALEELGYDEIDVRVPDRKLTQAEREAVALESNRNDGMWSWDKLANEFEVDLLKEVGFTDGELGLGNDFEEAKDEDDLKQSMDTYLDGNIKQIVLYFTKEQFDDVMPRIDAVMVKEGVENHTEAFLKTLKYYEDTYSAKKES